MSIETITAESRCILLSKDFLWGSRLCEAIKNRGHEVTMTTTLDNLPMGTSCSLVLYDLTLGMPTVEETATWCQQQDPVVPLVAFGPHIQETSLQRASAAGCDRVLTRGQLDQQLHPLLDNYLDP